MRLCATITMVGKERPISLQSLKKAATERWLRGSNISYVGIFLVVAIVIGYFAGSFLDSRLHTYPWLSIVGFLLGVGAGIRELFMVARQYQKENKLGEKNSQEQETSSPKESEGIPS